MKKKLLLDSDLILYRICSVHEQEIKYKNDVWVLTTNEKQITDAYRDYVAWLENLLDGEVVHIFSHPHSFRKEVYPEYKSNRKNTRKPMGFKAVKDTIMGENGVIFPSCEADDTIGILATGEYKGDCIIVSHDKDFLQIPGLLFNPGQQDNLSTELVEVDEQSALLHFFKQTLCGDTADGYTGCPGIGEVTFVKEINKIKEHKDVLTVEDLWSITLSLYSKKGLDESFALSQARCARILTHELYDHESMQPILWEPPTLKIN